MSVSQKKKKKKKKKKKEKEKGEVNECFWFLKFKK